MSRPVIPQRSDEFDGFWSYRLVRTHVGELYRIPGAAQDPDKASI